MSLDEQRWSPQCEVLRRGPLENAAFDVEARSMARAVPRPFCGIERKPASKVGAGGGDGVQLSRFVSIGGHRIAIDVDDPSRVVTKRVR